MTDVRTLALAMPLVFVLHVVEEAPLFVSWFNSRVMPPISEGSFLAVNAIAFAITLGMALALSASRAPGPALAGAAWVSFLMLANGLFHFVATVAHGSYCPGVITGLFLYLPLSLLFLRAVARETHVPALVVALVALAGALPMALHGYLIVFRGSRLF
jgi:Protein of unknown function with HXXEE motif